MMQSKTRSKENPINIRKKKTHQLMKYKYYFVQRAETTLLALV